MAGTPGFLPKAALVGSKAVYYPFTIPQQLNDSATKTGAALNGMTQGIIGSVGQAYVDLEPKGPAKWLVPLFQRGLEATQKSEQIAQRNKAVFWDPFSQGTEQVGRAIAGPGAYYYLRKAGMENPGQDAIKAVLQTGLFEFPVPAGGPPAQDGQAAAQQAAAQQAAAQQAAAQAAAAQAAAGAGQAGAPQAPQAA